MENFAELQKFDSCHLLTTSTLSDYSKPELLNHLRRSVENAEPRLATKGFADAEKFLSPMSRYSKLPLAAVWMCLAMAGSAKLELM